MISKDDLVYALNRQLQSSERGKRLETNLRGGEGIKKIADKYKESEYFDDLYELISVITHKIRNPLAGISAVVEVQSPSLFTPKDSILFWFLLIANKISSLFLIIAQL